MTDSYIGVPPKSGFINTAKQRVTSSTNNYVDLDHAISDLSDVIVWVNSVKQDSTNLSLTNPSKITLGGTLTASDVCEIVYLGKQVATQSPDTGSVTNSMLAGSIAQDKLSNEVINEAKLQVSNAPTNGYMLTAQSGNTGGLTWAEAPSGGVTLLNSSAATTGDSALSLTGVFNSTYEVYVVDVLGYQPSAAGYFLSQIGNSGGYLGSAINYFSGFGKQDENTNVDNHVAGTGQTAIYLHPTSTRSDDHLNMKINIYLPTGIGTYKPKLFYTGVYIQDSGSKSTAFFGQTSVDTTTTMTSIKFYPSTGTINDLQVKVYGFKKAT